MKCQFKRIPLIVFLAFSCMHAQSQTHAGGTYYQLHNNLSLTNLPSPNATDLGKYGDIPVSHHTGKAEVTIPLYSFTERGVTLDVGLSYDTSGLLVNQLPGCVGHGWTLNAGGCITRIVNYSGDEFYPEILGTAGKNYFQACSLMPVVGLETPSSLCGTGGEDFMPDIFHFNFMGKTGYFLLGNDGNWKVFSDTNLTVAFDAVNTIGGILNDTINYAYPFISHFYNRPDLPMSKSVRGFTLIDDEGIQYEFGGVTDAIEYSTDLFHIGEYDITMPLIATSWYLTRIRDRNGVTLYSFNYKRDYFMAQLSQVEYYEAFFSNSYFSVDCRGDALSGTLNAPVYLKSITTLDSTRFSFLYQDAFNGFQTSKVIYPSLYNQDGTAKATLSTEYNKMQPDHTGTSKKFFYLQDTLESAVHECQAPTSSNRVTDPLSSIGMRVVKEIHILCLDNHAIGKSYGFEYNLTGRIHLIRINVNNLTNSCEGRYEFQYNDFDKIPADYLTDRYDHWGFYKPVVAHINPENFQLAIPPVSISHGGESGLGIELVTIGGGTHHAVGTSILDYFIAYDSLRNSSITATQYGSLASITYPTGGCTRIVYEQNRYSKYVSDNHLSLVNEAGIAGGLRVRSIADYESNTSTSPLRKRTYTYNLPDGQTSSGTLFAKPRYYFYWGTTRVDGGHVIHMNTCRSAPIRPLSNSHGPHVGYSYVTETNLDGSRTVYHYSNIEDAMDSRFTYTLCDTTASPYDKFTERGYKRGKLLSASTYDQNGLLMSSVSNTYRGNDAEDNYVYASNMFYYQNPSDADVRYYRGGTYKIFYPKYDLERSVKSIRHGNVLLSDTIYYTYLYDDTLSYRYDNKPYRANISKLASVANKRGEVRTDDIYTYPLEESVFTDGYYLPATSLESRQNNNVQVRKETVYGIFNGKLHPQYDIAYIGTSTVPDTLVSYLSYTVNGRLREYVSKGESKTTLLWDSNDRLVARVKGDINPDSLEYIKVYPMMEGEDEPVIDMMNDVDYQFFLKYNGTDIFSYPNVSAEVYGYNYKGNPVYIQSGNGVAKHYSYDRDGRLTETMDADWETKSSFDYNYSTGHQRPILNP